MTRGIVLVLLALVVGACSPPRPDPAMVAQARFAQAAAAEAWRASEEQQAVAGIAGSLQTNPFVDPAVRANPWPCARAIMDSIPATPGLLSSFSFEAAGLYGRGVKPPCYAEALVRERAATVTVVPLFVIGR
jgi:hypothetical protein